MLTEKSNQDLRAEHALDYFQNIVETVREPLIILDADLRVTGASRSFYRTFNVIKEETEGRLIYELGDRQWDHHSAQYARARYDLRSDASSQTIPRSGSNRMRKNRAPIVILHADAQADMRTCDARAASPLSNQLRIAGASVL